MRTMGLLTAAASTTAVTLAFSTAACRGQEKEEYGSLSSPQSSSELSSPSHPATPPALPVGARDNTAEGAEAFIRYWFEATNWAQQNGRIDILEPLEDERKCRSCRVGRELILNIHRKGVLEGGDYFVRDIKLSKTSAGFFAALTYDQAGSRVLDRRGNPLPEFKFDPPVVGGRVAMTVDWIGSGWLVTSADEVGK